MDTFLSGKCIALTGATGFLGSEILRQLLEAGGNVRALTRRDQPAQTNVTWIKGDMSDKDALERLVDSADVVIHCAGLVKAKRKTEFFTVNEDGVRTILAATQLKAPDALFLLISSQTAKAGHLSPYAASKAAGEAVLTSSLHQKHSIVRPPAIYGPGDVEFLPLFKAVRSPLVPNPTPLHAPLAMIHVRDAAAAIVAALSAPLGLYEIDDQTDPPHTRAKLVEAVAKVQGKAPRLVPVGLFVLQFFGLVNMVICRLRGVAPLLTPAKAREISLGDWGVTDRQLTTETGWTPQIDLQTGLEETLQWYRTAGHISE